MAALIQAVLKEELAEQKVVFRFQGFRIFKPLKSLKNYPETPNPIQAALEVMKEELAEQKVVSAGLRGELRKYTQLALKLEGQASAPPDVKAGPSCTLPPYVETFRTRWPDGPTMDQVDLHPSWLLDPS